MPDFSYYVLLLFLKGFGLSECLICPAGYYCDDDTTTNAVLQNKTCPEGMHCDNGTVQAPDLFDFSCPAGFYCLRGSTVISLQNLY